VEICLCLTELLQWWNHVQVFRKMFKNLLQKQKVSTCVIHRCALPSRTLPTPLKNLLDSTIQITDCIKSRSLNTCLFKELCKDMNSADDLLLFHTSVRSLSKGNVLPAFFWLRTKWSYSKNWKQTSSHLTLVTRFGWKVSRKGYKHHPASRRICKHFIGSYNIGVVK